MNKYLCIYPFITICISSALGGELKKDYFGATQPGDWVTQELTAPDGSKSTYISKRLPDEDGRVVAELSVKVLAGAGEGSDSKNTVHLPADFNFARDWLSYGKFTEKMSMEYSGMVMPIDESTLEIIRDSSKDYRGAVTFVGEETLDGYLCDRYSYSVAVAGPTPQKETGDLWLNDTVPFGIVRQAAKTTTEDGTVVSSYDITLTDKGREELTDTSAETPAPEGESHPAPVDVGLLEGYQSELFALDISAVPGTGGRKLDLTLRNKTGGEVTVKIPKGNLDVPGSIPVEKVSVTFVKAVEVVLPPEDSSNPITVNQRGKYGPVGGTFTLSYYEGTAYFTGSVEMDILTK